MKERPKQRGRILKGEPLDIDEPDWGPLENVIEFDVCDDFMWMYAVDLEDGTRLHVYKHHWNRRSLHLGTGGQAFVYIWTLDDPDFDPDAPSEYEEVQLHRVLAAVLGSPRWPAVEERSRTEFRLSEARGGP